MEVWLVIDKETGKPAEEKVVLGYDQLAVFKTQKEAELWVMDRLDRTPNEFEIIKANLTWEG